MPLDDTQVAFLESLDRGAKLKEAFDRNQRFREALLERVANDIDEARDTLREGMDFEMSRKRGKGIFRNRHVEKTMDKRGQMHSVESKDITNESYIVGEKGLKVPQQDQRTQYGKAMDAMQIVLREVEILRGQLRQQLAGGGTPEDLFDLDDIRKELIEPLVREGLLADTFVAEALSVTQKMLNEVMGEYTKAVQQAKEEEERKDSKDLVARMGEGFDAFKAKAKGKVSVIQEKLETPNGRRAMALYSIVSKGNKAFSAIEASALAEITVLGPVGQHTQRVELQDHGSDPKGATKKIGMGAVKIGENAYKMYEANEKVEKSAKISKRKRLEDAVRRAAMEIVDALAGSLESAVSAADKDAARLVGLAYTSAVPAAKLADLLLQEPAKSADAIQLLADGFSQALASCQPANPAFASVGQAVASAFLGRAKPVIFDRAMVEQKPEEAVPPLVTAALSASYRVLDLDEPPQAPTEDDPGDQPSPDSTAFKNALKDPRVKEVMQNKVDEKLEQEALEDYKRSQEELKEYRRKLAQIDSAGMSAADERSILLLIQKLVKDQFTLKLVKTVMGTVSSGGFKIAGGVESALAEEGAKAIAEEFLAPLKALGAGTKFVVAIIEAADRGQMWIAMRGQVALALKAGSLMAPAIENFVKNQGEQMTYESVMAALHFAQFCGAVMSCTGVAAPIGEAISKTAAFGTVMTESIYEEIGYQELKKAWKVTRMAIRQPDNRKLGLQALSLNPTLAKYAIAYAAMEMDDPIARSVLEACGLNETTLTQKDAGVKTVQLYLQTRFKADQILDGTQSELKGELIVDWQPKKIELTSKCWLATKRRAETKAAPPLSKEKTVAIETALTALGTWEPKLKDGNNAAAPAVLRALDDLISCLGAYQPRRRDRGPHQEMQEVIDQFVEVAVARRTEVQNS